MPGVAFWIFVMRDMRVVQKLLPYSGPRVIVKDESMESILDQTPTHKTETE
jgi:hypothetical protein